MHRIDTSTAVSAPQAPDAAGTAGHFTKGDPLTGALATQLDQDWCEAVQEELIAILVWLGVTPNKASNGQIAAALAAALALKSPLANPTFTGVPAGPTAAAGTNTTQLATTAFVAAAINALVNAAPGALDTLKELADALGDDANFATTVTNALALKAPLASPTLTGVPAGPTAAAGTNTTQLATTAFVQQEISGNARTFCYPDISYSNGDHNSAAHGKSLSKVLRVIASMVCISTDMGFPVGAVVPPNSNSLGSGNDHGITVGSDLTNVYWTVSNNGIYATGYGSGPGNNSFDPTKWKIRISVDYLP